MGSKQGNPKPNGRTKEHYIMTRKTTQSKAELTNAVIGKTREERLSLSESRDKIYDTFYNNLRLLVAAQQDSMVELARKLNLKSGTRVSDLCYGRGAPSTEELMILAKHFNCSIDDLLYNKAIISWIRK
jgi:cyclopropane fatty-acyl-phospholipid synthase-like methyltransferase